MEIFTGQSKALDFNTITTFKKKKTYQIYLFIRHLGGSDPAFAFISGHNLRVLGSSPALGSSLEGESASPSPSAPTPTRACVLSLALSLK